MNTMQNPRMQAQALKRMGRGPDTQLIHMTDSEIDALNGLSALVFKEPLRTNPQTGLPEAGLFKRLLPTVLAIGAGAILGPGAGALFGKGAFATGLGTGLTAFGGHLAGQALTGQDLDFGRAALAGAGSGLTAGLTFNPAGAGTPAAAVDAANAASAATYDPVSGVLSDPNFVMGPSAGGLAPVVPSPEFSIDTIGGINEAGQLAQANIDKFAPSAVDLIRSPTDAFDYLAADPLKRVGAPLALAGVMGEFDEPLPEAPAGDGDRREPFVPTPLRATRERRDLDLDEDGEVTEKDIMQVVQGLPEGQSSRFFEPTKFTPVKTGGLVNLEQGGSVKQAIQNLTGGEGTAVLPILAQAIIKPKEEEEATTKGYPLGTPGTPPGMPTTGIAIGGGQPPQPFQTGGSTDPDDSSVSSGEFGSSVVGLASEAVPSTLGGALGTAASTGAKALGGIGMMSPPGLVISGLGYLGGKLFDTLTTPEPPPPAAPLQGPPTAEQAEAEDAAATAAAVSAMAGLGMDLGDQPEEGEPGNPSVPGGLPSLAQTAANVVSGVPGIGGPSGGSSDGPSSGPSGGGDDVGGFGGIGGPTGADDTSDDPDGGSSGGGSSDADASSGDPIKTGGQAGIGMERLLKFEQGGLAGIPYFEGRVMPTGDPKEDGMSDNIPFVIAGQEGGQMEMQPAILSPDEYVIPADVVSMLGNGSSTAGSNQLDQFISNFRMDKYGRPKQPPEMRGGLNSLA